MNNKKIAFFITSLDSGGIENYLLRFLNHYQEEIDAIVYCKSGKLGVLEKEYLAVGATLIPHSLGFFNLFDYMWLYKDLKDKGIDAVCDFTGNYAALPLLTAKIARINKRLAFFRGSTRHFKETSLRLFYDKLMNKILYLNATQILSNSKAALDFFFPVKVSQNKNFFKVIYNGIEALKFLSTKEDLRKELNIPKEAFVVGHVGRVAQAKNHETILDVAIELTKNEKDIYFLSCGSQTIEKFSSIVNLNRLDKKIKLLGQRRDIIKVLNTLNCFYFPSHTEGQPNALLEAMLVGVPFVASNIPPIKEITPAMYQEFLTPPRDKSAAILKIRSIKEMNYEELKIFKELSFQIKEQFKAEKMFKKFYNTL